MPKLIPGAARGFVCALLACLAPLAAAAQTGPAGQPTPTVTALVAEPTDFTLTARLPGRIKASTISEVRPQVSGIIRERLFEEGSRVEAGQPLYKIEDETYAAVEAAARAAVAQAQANYDLAVREAQRAEELFSTNTGSAQRRDNALAARDAADAALQLAQAQLQTAEIDLDRTTIRAPISGVIGFSQVTPGSLVAAQQAAALTIIRTLDPVYVDVTQSANDLLNWRTSSEGHVSPAEGQATMILPTSDVYAIKGELRAAEPQVEPTTGMISLRIAFPNPDSLLLPGLYVEVVLPQVEEKGVFLVPQSAVMRDQAGTPHVWLVENGTVVPRDLTIVTSSDSNWVVSEGLNAGDQIITSGFQKVAPGGPVEIVPTDPPAPAAGAAGEAPAPAEAAEAGEAAAPADAAPAEAAPAEGN